MNRVTPQQVVDAYKQTGWLPIRGEYIDERLDGTMCGCGLAVMVKAKDGLDSDFDIDNKIAKSLDLNEGYISGFIHGYDGDTELYESSDSYDVGYADGQAAWEAVSAEFKEVILL